MLKLRERKKILQSTVDYIELCYYLDLRFHRVHSLSTTELVSECVAAAAAVVVSRNIFRQCSPELR